MLILTLLIPFVISFGIAIRYYQNHDRDSLLFHSLLIGIFSTSAFTIVFLPGYFGTMSYFVGIPVFIISSYILIGPDNAKLGTPSEDMEKGRNALIASTLFVVTFYVMLTILRFTPLYIQIPISLITASCITIIKLKYTLFRSSIFYHIVESFQDAHHKKWWITYGIIGVLIIGSFFVRIPVRSLEESIHLENHVSNITRINHNLEADTNANYEMTIVQTLRLHSSDDIPYYYDNDGEIITIISHTLYEEYDALTLELLNKTVLPSGGFPIHAFYNDSLYIAKEGELYRLNEDNKIDNLANVSVGITGFVVYEDAFYAVTWGREGRDYYLLDETSYSFTLMTEEWKEVHDDAGIHSDIMTLHEVLEKDHIKEGGTRYSLHESNSKMILEVIESGKSGITVLPFEDPIVKKDTPIYHTISLEYDRDLEVTQVIRVKENPSTNTNTIEVLHLQRDNVDLELPFYTYFSSITILLIVFIFFIPVTDYKGWTVTQSFINETN